MSEKKIEHSSTEHTNTLSNREILNFTKDTKIRSIKALSDLELLTATKSCAQKERAAMTEVLHHLREIERRKLYCDLRHNSLFDYAVRELGYSEAAAARRIQAMRLLVEIPELEAKIESGALHLSNISQAQSFFREVKKTTPEQAFSRERKKEILEKLEQKSAREAERILISLGAPQRLPLERERVVSPEHTEIRFLVDEKLKAQLDEVRGLLGHRGATLGLAELISEMAALSAERLKEKHFGKRRAREAKNPKSANSNLGTKANDHQPPISSGVEACGRAAHKTPNSDVGVGADATTQNAGTQRMNRYIPKALKHHIWQQTQGRCSSCGSQQHLQFDHIQPLALGGLTTAENLQLLCRSCNLRRGIQTFGASAMRRD